jgi:hypothetical protein
LKRLPPERVTTLIWAPELRPNVASAFDVMTRNSRMASVEIRFGEPAPKSAAPPPSATPPAAPRSSLRELPSRM